MVSRRECNQLIPACTRLWKHSQASFITDEKKSGVKLSIFFCSLIGSDADYNRLAEDGSDYLICCVFVIVSSQVAEAALCLENLEYSSVLLLTVLLLALRLPYLKSCAPSSSHERLRPTYAKGKKIQCD